MVETIAWRESEPVSRREDIFELEQLGGKEMWNLQLDQLMSSRSFVPAGLFASWSRPPLREVHACHKNVNPDTIHRVHLLTCSCVLVLERSRRDRSHPLPLRGTCADAWCLVTAADVFLNVSVTATRAGRAVSELAGDRFECTTVAFPTEIKDADLQDPHLQASEFQQV